MRSLTLHSQLRLWRTLAFVALGIAGSVAMFYKAAATTGVSASSGSQVVARVGNHSITLREAEQRVALPLYQIDQQRSQLLLYAVQQLIDAELLRVESLRTGKTVEQFLGTPPSSSLPDTAGPIETQLGLINETKSHLERQSRIVAMRRQTSIHIDLPRIISPVLAVSSDDDPSIGDRSAPVTIVEFSDFQCPFCKRSAGVVKEVLRAYGENVRYVYRDYPSPSHIYAKQAAEAGQCAGAQGKFWAYHDLLFEHQQSGHGWDFNQLAQQASLDTAAFSHCLVTHEYASEVQADLQEALKVGVTSTPTFFINGHPLIGARSFEDFKLLIDAALAEGNYQSAS